MICTFVITFCSSRINQLNQCLRLLHFREPELAKSQIVLVCQDQCEYTNSPFDNTVVINLDMPTYKRPVMLNVGVSRSTSDIVVLLDGDRILPHGYFKNVINSIKPKEVITTARTRRITHHVTDEQIETMQFNSFFDDRSMSNEFMCKNLFSGNTTMLKCDYVACGGMDEQFEGYGFNDNDMTKTVLSNGFKAIYRDDIELHLHHPRDFNYEGKPTPHTRIMAVTNCNKYCRKWGYYPSDLHVLNDEITRNLNDYPENLRAEFCKHCFKWLL